MASLNLKHVIVSNLLKTYNTGVPMNKKNGLNNICVLGGAGRIGLPLSLALADKGLQVTIYDINVDVVDMINSGTMPFYETGTEKLLKANLGKNLTVTTSTLSISQADYIIIIIGTPVDEYLNPKVGDILRVINEIRDFLMDGQCIIMRSTIYPGTTEHLRNQLKALGKNISLAYCPERVAEGVVLEELKIHPQIISNKNNFTLFSTHLKCVGQ